MNHLYFVIAAYAITGAGIIWLIGASYLAMRRSEDLANDLQKRG
jgi:Heme exporter protein D (CcmD)